MLSWIYYVVGMPHNGNLPMNKFDQLDVLIRHKNGKIIAGIPQIGLFAKGSDVNGALAALDLKKNAFLADLEEAGELDLLDLAGNPAPLLRVGKTRSPGGLGQFAMKTLIVVGIIFGAIIFSSLLVAKKVELPVKNAIASIKGIKIGGSEFWTRLENELDRMARPENDLPEAKKKKLIADIHAIAAKWRPYLVEIQSILASPNDSSASTEASPNKKTAP